MTTPLDASTLSGITRIYVGTKQTPYDVHIELLRSCSPYFDRLFKGHSIEEIRNNPVPLPTEDEELFGDLISWIYRGSISKYAVAKDSAFFLLRLWVLAGSFEMPLLQNYVMSHFLVVMNTHPGGVYDEAKIRFVYDNTKPGSPLRLLVADMWTRNGSDYGYPELLQSLPRVFLEDICSTLFELTDHMPQDMSEDEFQEKYYLQAPAKQEPEKRELPDDDEESIVPRRATPAQMSRRKIITPKSHLHTTPNASRMISS